MTLSDMGVLWGREELLKEFQNTGHAVLNKAQEAFLARAEERLGHSEKASEERAAITRPLTFSKARTWYFLSFVWSGGPSRRISHTLQGACQWVP
mgnify:CR=1 FL=1